MAQTHVGPDKLIFMHCSIYTQSCEVFLVYVNVGSPGHSTEVHLQPRLASLAPHHGGGHFWRCGDGAGSPALRGADEKAAAVVAQADP